jgi:hypothetical protein
VLHALHSPRASPAAQDPTFPHKLKTPVRLSSDRRLLVRG